MISFFYFKYLQTGAITQLSKNIGDSDISKIGDGTVKGAISQLNTETLKNESVVLKLVNNWGNSNNSFKVKKYPAGLTSVYGLLDGSTATNAVFALCTDDNFPTPANAIGFPIWNITDGKPAYCKIMSSSGKYYAFVDGSDYKGKYFTFNTTYMRANL